MNARCPKRPAFNCRVERRAWLQCTIYIYVRLHHEHFVTATVAYWQYSLRLLNIAAVSVRSCTAIDAVRLLRPMTVAWCTDPVGYR